MAPGSGNALLDPGLGSEPPLLVLLRALLLLGLLAERLQATEQGREGRVRHAKYNRGGGGRILFRCTSSSPFGLLSRREAGASRSGQRDSGFAAASVSRLPWGSGVLGNRGQLPLGIVSDDGNAAGPYLWRGHLEQDGAGGVFGVQAGVLGVREALAVVVGRVVHQLDPVLGAFEPLHRDAAAVLGGHGAGGCLLRCDDCLHALEARRGESGENVREMLLGAFVARG